MRYEEINDLCNRTARDTMPTLENLKDLLEYPDRRIKPLVLIMISSGMRLEGWQWLQLKHVTPVDKNCQPASVDKIEEMVAAKLTVYAGEPEQYTSFIRPEAYNALQEWINYRKENGEIIGSES